MTFEENLFEAKTIQLDLLRQLRACEQQLRSAEENAKKAVKLNQELEKEQAIYIAHRHDPIDNALGNYLNSHPERDAMKIMFLRESEGVYKFGSKRVYVKIEKGEAIMVRVGGRYMHIDEFIA